MNQSTPTPERNTTPPSVEGSGASTPALAYTNPQPRLPHSEAAPPEQPETFIRRARRLKLGSHRLKTGFLSLCTFGRAWTRGTDVLEIGIKQGTLAGDLECKRATLVELLRDLRATGHVQVLRKKYHSLIRIFLTPHMRDDPKLGSTETDAAQRVDPKLGSTETDAAQRDDPKLGSTETDAAQRDDPKLGSTETDAAQRDDPKLGSADDPKLGSTKVFRSSTYVQQQQHAASRRTDDPKPGSSRNRATEKQLAGIASMAAELGIPAPEPENRLAADVAFRELRERVLAQREDSLPPLATESQIAMIQAIENRVREADCRTPRSKLAEMSKMAASSMLSVLEREEQDVLGVDVREFTLRYGRRPTNVELENIRHAQRWGGR